MKTMLTTLTTERTLLFRNNASGSLGIVDGYNDYAQIICHSIPGLVMELQESSVTYYHLHILSEQNISEGDWYLYNENNNSKNSKWRLRFCSIVEGIPGAGVFYDGCHHIWCYKIEKSTNPRLGLPMISKEFLIKYCKNNGIYVRH
jgi:hypothetical protein